MWYPIPYTRELLINPSEIMQQVNSFKWFFMMLLITVLQISDVSCIIDTHSMLLGIVLWKIWEGITGF